MKLVTNVQGAKAESVARGAEKLAEEAGTPAGISVQENVATDQVTIVVDSDSLRQTAKNLRQQAALMKVQAGRVESQQIEARHDGHLQTARATEKTTQAEKLNAEAAKAAEASEEAKRQLEQVKHDKADNERKQTSTKESIQFEERRAKQLRDEGQYKLSFAADPIQMQAAMDLLAAADIHLATASALRTGELGPLVRLADALKDSEDHVSLLARDSLERAQQAKSSGEEARAEAGRCKDQAAVSFQQADSLQKEAAEIRQSAGELESRAALQESIAAAGENTVSKVLAQASA